MSNIPFTSIYPDGPAGSQAAAADGGGNSGNDLYPGMPAGAVPFHRDYEWSATSGTFDVWAPSTPGTRAVVASCLISTDTAGRIAVVDGTDAMGYRIAVLRAGANGGASPNLVPVPWPSRNPGNVIRLVVGTSSSGFVRVSGWEQAA